MGMKNISIFKVRKCLHVLMKLNLLAYLDYNVQGLFIPPSLSLLRTSCT